MNIHYSPVDAVTSLSWHWEWDLFDIVENVIKFQNWNKKNQLKRQEMQKRLALKMWLLKEMESQYDVNK